MQFKELLRNQNDTTWAVEQTVGGSLMYNAADLLKKLSEIENLVRENTNQDGSCDFDAERIFMSLELARRMFEQG